MREEYGRYETFFLKASEKKDPRKIWKIEKIAKTIGEMYMGKKVFDENEKFTKSYRTPPHIISIIFKYREFS